MKMRSFRLEKLVRDGIVEDTEKEGGVVDYSVLRGAELMRAILDKIPEEIEEAKVAKDKEELKKEIGDIRDLLFAAAEAAGIEEIIAHEPSNTYKQGHFIHKLTLPETNKWTKYYQSRPDRFPEITE